MSSKEPASSLARAQQLLASGAASEALRIVQLFLHVRPERADVHHLHALALASLGDPQGALRAFGRALELEPTNEMLLRNLGVLLRQSGDGPGAAKRLLEVAEAAPFCSAAWREFAVTALVAGFHQEAVEGSERAVALDPRSGEAWRSLGVACHTVGDLDRAREALEHARLRRPGLKADLDLATVVRLSGDPVKALRILEASEQRDAPELQDLRVGALLETGKLTEAIAAAEASVASNPDFAPAYTTYAHLLWEYGGVHDRAGADDVFRRGIERGHGGKELRASFVRWLLAGARAEDALAEVLIARQQGDSLELQQLEADAREATGDLDGAGRLYDVTMDSAGQRNAPFRNAVTRHLLRTGQWRRAGDCAIETTRIAPMDQEAWAYLATAWRLTNDPRGDALCDLERSVGELLVDVPGVPIETLAELVSGLHAANHAPRQQTLRSGTQTPGRLLHRPIPEVAAAARALIAAVERWLAQLPRVESHPFLARNAGRAWLGGSWSVRLNSGGRHVNHIHPEGWLSAVFYLAVPPAVARGARDDGCLILAEPPEELGLPLEPQRVIRPRAGRLVVFPSYLWHGTRPFQDPDPRLTIAFDMLPRR